MVCIWLADRPTDRPTDRILIEQWYRTIELNYYKSLGRKAFCYVKVGKKVTRTRKETGVDGETKQKSKCFTLISSGLDTLLYAFKQNQARRRLLLTCINYKKALAHKLVSKTVCSWVAPLCSHNDVTNRTR